MFIKKYLTIFLFFLLKRNNVFRLTFHYILRWCKENDVENPHLIHYMTSVKFIENFYP